MRDSIEVASDVRAELGEGPAWDGERSELLWVDIAPGHVHLYEPGTGTDRVLEVGQAIGAAVPRKGGGYVLAAQDGFALLDRAGAVVRLASVEEDRAANRMNDGKCDRHGRFWAGTMAFDSRPGAGTLYRLDPDRSVTAVLEGVTISNGLAWSLDDHTMYYIDSPTQGVDCFDYDPATGSVGNRRRLIEVPEQAGTPDGMAIDCEGCLWVALYGGAAVRRYQPDGSLDRVVELPTTQITSCAFGGPELTDLYITSARENLSREALDSQPLAGALFRHRAGVAGLPTAPFGG